MAAESRMGGCQATGPEAMAIIRHWWGRGLLTAHVH